MNGNETKKLKVKDIITVVLLAMINVVLFFASSLLYVTPYTIMPVSYTHLDVYKRQDDGAVIKGLLYDREQGVVVAWDVARAKGLQDDAL